MTPVEHITPIVKLNLRLQCSSRVYAIIVMHTKTLIGEGADAAAIQADRNNN